MATYTVTNEFGADETAIAAEVNTNFTELLTALNAFDASNLASGTVPLARISGLTVSQLAAATLVTEAEGVGNNDNDTTLPSSAAVKDYVDTNVGSANWTPTSYAAEESVTFPNGLIMKFGVGASCSANSSKTVTFGTAFPTAIMCVNITHIGSKYSAAAGARSVSAQSTTSFTYANGVAQAGTFNWIAIGY